MKSFFGIIFLTVLITGNVMNAQKELPPRDKIDDKFKWNLDDFYENEDLWEKDFLWVKENLKRFEDFKGKLGSSSETLVNCFQFQEDIQKKYSRVYFYGYSAMHLDLNDGHFQSMYQRIQTLGSELEAASSFITPEILTIPEKKMDSFIAKNGNLKEYKHLLKNIYRTKAHTLSQNEEKLLAMLSPVSDIPRNTYVILNDAELPFPTVKDSKGSEIKISHGRYRSALYSKDRSYRKTVYKGLYMPYKDLKSTLATIFNGRIKTRLIEAEIRNYDNPVQAALFQNNIPVDVYNNLVKSVRKNVKSLHRWADLKKKVLGYDELHPYDSYASLFPGVQKEYSYEEAQRIILEALKPLGGEYTEAVKKAFDNRWIDVYETKGKRSGAYSNSCACGVHPIILLNWSGTLDDVFTLAHELGHNMHSYFTEKHQPFHYADYSIFVAEVASITNEALLLEYMVQTAETKEEKLALLEKFLVNAQATFFRQTRFADFEKQVHEDAIKGIYHNPGELTEMFAKQYGEYWGPAMTVDEEEGYSWARIPHLFKYNFYVYQYATGFAAAQALSEQILEEGQPAVDRYLKNFLYAGNSDYPINVLKNAGVDMSSPEPVEKTIEKINEYLDRLEKLLGE